MAHSLTHDLYSQDSVLTLHHTCGVCLAVWKANSISGGAAMSHALTCSVQQPLAARGVCGGRGVDAQGVMGLLQHWNGLQYDVSIHGNKSNLTRVCVLWLQVRANIVAITLDISEEEIHFQFGMGNWSSYVDQV